MSMDFDEVLAKLADKMEDAGDARAKQLRLLVRPTACAWDGCEAAPKILACGRARWWYSEPTMADADDLEEDRRDPRHPAPGWYCKKHAAQVADENSPEYTNNCPACDCYHGVN